MLFLLKELYHKNL